MHYTEKCPPTLTAASIWMHLATTATKDGKGHHFDAVKALLKANIDEEICIKVIDEYQEFPGGVGLLKKAIYGLVQAGRCWDSKYCDDMTTIGFEQPKVYPCVFRKTIDGEVKMVVVVHVNDILAHAKDQATIERLTAELGRNFRLKDMGDAKYYMGYHITRDRKARELKFQNLYVNSMLKTFGFEKANGMPAYLSKADKPQTPKSKKEMLKFPYRVAVGALMWTETMIRPYIACAVRAVARLCKNSVLAHKEVVLKATQYLLQTKEWGITYGGQGCGLNMGAYTDTDCGACLDTRRSVSGAIVMLAKGARSAGTRGCKQWRRRVPSRLSTLSY